MIEATRMRSGCAFLMREIRGIHQSSGLSEISSQFHDECSAVPGRFLHRQLAVGVEARRNFVFGPSTLTTGCRPMVLVTTPPQPASKARMMLASDSVGGADESRNGFGKLQPRERDLQPVGHGGSCRQHTTACRNVRIEGLPGVRGKLLLGAGHNRAPR